MSDLTRDESLALLRMLPGFENATWEEVVSKREREMKTEQWRKSPVSAGRQKRAVMQ